MFVLRRRLLLLLLRLLRHPGCCNDENCSGSVAPCPNCHSKSSGSSRSIDCRILRCLTVGKCHLCTDYVPNLSTTCLCRLRQSRWMPRADMMEMVRIFQWRNYYIPKISFFHQLAWWTMKYRFFFILICYVTRHWPNSISGGNDFTPFQNENENFVLFFYFLKYFILIRKNWSKLKNFAGFYSAMVI